MDINDGVTMTQYDEILGGIGIPVDQQQERKP